MHTINDNVVHVHHENLSHEIFITQNIHDLQYNTDDKSVMCECVSGGRGGRIEIQFVCLCVCLSLGMS